jgi:AAA15 family ATPase/GTPase
MLKFFSVRNYKGFKDEIKFDFSDFKDYKFNTNAIRNKLINKAVIYGKNGSGKSNFGFAIFDITLHLVDKYQHPEQRTNYFNADSIESSAVFKYEFLLNDKTIVYEYTKDEHARLTSETFLINTQKIFGYNFLMKKGDFAGLKLLKLENSIVSTINMNISVLRYLAKNTNIEANSEISLLMNFVEHMLWFRSADGNQFIGFQNGGDDLIATIIRDGQVEQFEKYLNDADINLKLKQITDPLGKSSIYAEFSNHPILFWQIASNGTKVLTLYYYWLQRFKQASFIFIDEFDAFFHTILAEKLLIDMRDKIKTQLMITTHNTDLMSNSILRPDCYFILTEGKLLSLPNCTERELREGHNLEKMFKNGEFN